MRGGVEVTVEDISIARQDEGDSNGVGSIIDKVKGAAKAAMGKGDLTARLNVKNKTALSVYITAARYSIFMGDKEIGKGNWTATEGAPAPAPSNTTAVLRALGGCTAPTDNSKDFTAGAPMPPSRTRSL